MCGLNWCGFMNESVVNSSLSNTTSDPGNERLDRCTRLKCPRLDCPPACKITHKDHNNTIQIYSVTVMTHVKALETGQSSQGTFEPIKPDHVWWTLRYTSGHFLVNISIGVSYSSNKVTSAWLYWLSLSLFRSCEARFALLAFVCYYKEDWLRVTSEFGYV